MSNLQRYHAADLPQLLERINKNSIGMDDFFDGFFNGQNDGKNHGYAYDDGSAEENGRAGHPHGAQDAQGGDGRQSS